MSTNLNILFIADIVSDPGLQSASLHLPDIKEMYNTHLVIANGENCASGKGLTAKLANKLFDIGIDAITTGNHIWNRNKFLPILDENPLILRPLNYPPGCPGHGSCIVQTEQNYQIGIINIQGRSFMYPIDCPFRSVESEITNLKNAGVKIIIIDFHAEATAEKMALAWFVDGRVSAVIGSHTHVQTADERILHKGTAYITDAGMTGSFDSVIGMNKEVAIRRFMTQIPVHYKTAHGDSRFNGVLITVDSDSGRAKSISRIQLNSNYS